MIERPFSIDLPDGATLHGEVRSPEGDPPSSAVVVVHGFKGFKDWGFFPYLCECLTRDGHAVVSFNFSLNGIGEDPTAFTDLEAFGRNTLSREVEEILRILHEVRDGGITLPAPDPRGAPRPLARRGRRDRGCARRRDGGRARHMGCGRHLRPLHS